MPSKAAAVRSTDAHTSFARNRCFGCGPDNPAGLQLKFTVNRGRNGYTSRFRLDDRFTGPPGHSHGGIIATILDEAMGKVNKLCHVVALTAQMTVNYLKPVPLDQPLRVLSRELRIEGRKHIHSAEIVNRKGEVLARSEGIFIAIDPARMFQKYANQG